jgi:hypothetical protein
LIKFTAQTPTQAQWTHRAPRFRSGSCGLTGQARNPTDRRQVEGMQGVCLRTNCQTFQVLDRPGIGGGFTKPVASSHQGDGVSYAGRICATNLLFLFDKPKSRWADSQTQKQHGTSPCDVEHEFHRICRIRSRVAQPFDTLLRASPAPLAAYRGSGTMMLRDQTNTDDRQVLLPRALKERSSERIRR